MKTGLCSIAFRQLNPQQVVDLVKRSGLDAIEWGGDIHVPSGEPALAEQVSVLTHDAGLAVAAYGSYYRVLDEDGRPIPFEPVLESALALQTDTIRIWAGDRSSGIAGAEYTARMLGALNGVLEQAQAHNMKIGLEFHADTLNDSNEAANRLLQAVEHPNLYTYWQPVYWLTDRAYRMDGLRRMRERILNLHVFQWNFSPKAGAWGDATDRRPLEEGAAEWLSYLREPLNDAVDHYALIEFVRDDDPDQFLADAAVLKEWLGEI